MKKISRKIRKRKKIRKNSTQKKFHVWKNNAKHYERDEHQHRQHQDENNDDTTMRGGEDEATSLMPISLRKNTAKYFIKVVPIKMMLVDTNEKEVPFTFDMLKNKTNNDPIQLLSKSRKVKENYPLFTNNIKYPSSLFSMSYDKILEFFFNKLKFKNVLEEYAETYPDDANYQSIKEKSNHTSFIENEKHNINIMMCTLLQILPSTYINPKNSFDHFILGKDSFNIGINKSNIKMAINIGTSAAAAAAASAEKYILDMVWLNDIYNHPVYADFIEKYGDIIQKKIEIKNNADLNEENAVRVFFEKLEKLNDKSKSSKTNTNAMLIYNRFNELSKSMYNDEKKISKLGIQLLNDVLHFDDKNGKIQNHRNNGGGGEEEDKYLLAKIGENIVSILYEISNVRNYSSRTILEQKLMTIFKEMYNAYVSYMACVKVSEFVNENKGEISLKKTYNDGSNKSKIDIDIINEIENKHGVFIRLNNELKDIIKKVDPSFRNTSNVYLKDEIESVVKKSKSYKETYFLENVYTYYFLEKSPDRSFNKDMMYTGVNIMNTKSDTKNDMNAYEYAEIYVSIKTIGVNVYEESSTCNINDMHLGQKINYAAEDKSHSVSSYMK
jgi:hypothetical protein